MGLAFEAANVIQSCGRIKLVLPLKEGFLAIFARCQLNLWHMKDAIKSNASRFGLIAAAISVGYTLLAYLVDITLMVNYFAGIGLWIVGLIIFILAVSRAKKQMGGFITFRDAFSTFILAYIIFALISTSFNILLFGVIDTAAAEEIRELTIEAQVELMENIGAPEDQIEENIQMLEEGNPYGIGSLVQGFFWGIVIYAIIGLIVAAIMKKNPPAYMEGDTGTEA